MEVVTEVVVILIVKVMATAVGDFACFGYSSQVLIWPFEPGYRIHSEMN